MFSAVSRTIRYLSISLLPQNAHRRVILQNSEELKIHIRNEISCQQRLKKKKHKKQQQQQQQQQKTVFLCYAMKYDGLFSNYANIFFFLKD